MTGQSITNLAPDITWGLRCPVPVWRQSSETRQAFGRTLGESVSEIGYLSRLHHRSNPAIMNVRLTRANALEWMPPLQGRSPRDKNASLSLVHVGDVPASPAAAGRLPSIVAFDRRELQLILGVYGRKVAQG